MKHILLKLIIINKIINIDIFLYIIKGLIRLYESFLQEQNPNARNINYDIADLNGYIDRFEDIGALV